MNHSTVSRYLSNTVKVWLAMSVHFPSWDTHTHTVILSHDVMELPQFLETKCLWVVWRKHLASNTCEGYRVNPGLQ